MTVKNVACMTGLVATVIGSMLGSALLSAQAPATPAAQRAPEPWRFAGERPCARPDGGVVAVPAGRRARTPSAPAACSTASPVRC